MRKLSGICILFCFITTSALPQKNMSKLGVFTYTNELNDIWGYADELGNEYAIVGVYNGVSVVDVSDPFNPKEVFWAPGSSSVWRDIKTWKDHAYITNETGGGLMIIDLSPLPEDTNLPVVSYTGSTYPFIKAHNLYIDNNGTCYIFGANNSLGGAIMLNLTDPKNPVESGAFNNHYIHDGVVRGDTLWASAINNGFFSVINVSDKANPVQMASHPTGPPTMSHNCWISDDNKTLFTTDEASSAFIGSYDVADLGNIKQLDKVQSNPGSGVIPHNTHFINNFLVTSYYRDGVTIHDVSRSGNMIQTGNYDTSPYSGNGFNGCWGVYPWLPSGNVIAADIEQGLFILKPIYKKACYLEGNVTSAVSGTPLNNASVEILTQPATAATDITGKYATGAADSGTYSVRFTKGGFATKIISGVSLNNGILTMLNVQLDSLIPFSFSGKVKEKATGDSIPEAMIKFQGLDSLFSIIADAAGNFTIASMFEENYKITAGKWSYTTKCFDYYIDSNTANFIIQLDTGYYDDFTFDLGWTVNSTATSGLWERAVAKGTLNKHKAVEANPGADVDKDCSDEAYITGNNGVNAGDDDVDGGHTRLISPLFNLAGYSNPYISYYRWFFNAGGFGSPNDTLLIELSNGDSTKIIETVTVNSLNNSSWVYSGLKISDFITPSDSMQMFIQAADRASSGHLVEAGFDIFAVYDNGLPPMTDFIALKTAVCTGDTIIFENNSVNATSYKWLFSGGKPDTSSSQNLSVIYDSAGTFDVSLTTDNPFFEADTLVRKSYIKVYNNVTAQFSADRDTVFLDQSGNVIFSNSSNGAETYIWDFGDGSSSLSVNPSHTYSSAGTKTVILTAENPGCSSPATKVIYVFNSVGFEEFFFRDSKLRVYPNPFENVINIEGLYDITVETEERIFLSVSDLAGRIVLDKEIRSDKDKISLEDDLAPGFYFIKIKSGVYVSPPVKLIKLRF